MCSGRNSTCFEDFRVGLETDEGAVRFGGLALLFVLELALLEAGFDELALAEAADEEFLREGVDGFGADAVEADAELEDVVVVLGAGVDLGDAVHDFAQRDAAAEIADGDGFVLDGDLDFLAGAHDEFVNGVINDLLEQDVAAVVVMGAVADAADVHAGAQPDVLQRGERLDFALVIDVLVGVSHSLKSQSKEYQGEGVGCQVRSPAISEANPYWEFSGAAFEKTGSGLG